MYCYLTSIVMGFISHVYGTIDLSRIPNPQRNFNIETYLGTWYDQGKIAPCSWSGSREFQDWRLNFRQEGDQLYLVSDWRSGDQCVTVKNRLFEKCPGYYFVKDPIGDVFSGEEMIVATDYKRFSITHGCVKRTVDGETCDDAWLSIETRRRFPDPYTLKLIDIVLVKLYGIRLSQTERVKHKQSCKFDPQHDACVRRKCQSKLD